MKLSEQLRKDFSELAPYPNRNYKISQDYLNKLISDIQALEEKLAHYQMDGNPLNNHPDNLQWGTAKENAEDRSNHERTITKRGDDNSRNKLSNEDVKHIYSLKGTITATALSKQYPVCYQTICKIWNGKKKAWLTKTLN